MASITRYIVRYKHPYMHPARYTSTTKFVLEDNAGERFEYLCGSTYKSYNHFIKIMKERHGNDLKVDRTTPYVIYQS